MIGIPKASSRGRWPTRTSRNRLHSKARVQHGLPLCLTRSYDFMFSHKPLVFDVEWLSRQQLKLLENCPNRDDCRLTMKLLFVSTVAVVLLVGCKSARQTTFQTPSISIHEAAEKGNVEAIKNHCDAGTDVNEKNKYGDAPLHIAAVRTSGEVAKLLIEKGADVNIKTKWGRTPLAEAASVGSREIAELLIAEGADINAREKGGGTPLHQATYGDHVEVAELLIANGANVNAQDDGGYTPMNYSYGETASLLLKHGGKTKGEL